jgi:L-alanine-DL-glutamate epimerase-like enolase superfamily enzyme
MGDRAGEAGREGGRPAPLSRRGFLAAAAAVAARPAAAGGGAPAVVVPNPADVRVEDVRHRYEDFRYRTPMKFGGREVDRVTLLHVDCVVRARDGRTAKGAGSMPLGNVWAYPSRQLPFEETLSAMKALAERIAPLTGGCRAWGHAVDLATTLEPEWLRAAAELSRGRPEPIPKLATLVVASPFDAALHDAYGKVHRRSVYRAYGPEFLPADLGRYLDAEFAGDRLERHVLADPRPRVFIYHAVGASDPLTDAEVTRRVGDGLPETLAEWVPRDGLTHFKVKMNGDDAAWDVGRVLSVERVVVEQQAKRGAPTWWYSLDFNERCPNAAYLLEVLRKIREGAPAAFGRIQIVEQPTRRDLASDRANVMHEAAKLRPVVIDESLTDLETLRLAREMGYTGVALKACKGQTQALLMAAAARKHGMFLCVQDLTCPGAAYVQSLGLAARVPGVAAVEANARQYVPAASAGWDERFPALFRIREGQADTSGLTGDGLGAVA